MPCILDRFPVEVLHMVFDYLRPYDLIYAFTDIDSSIDTILQSYNRIRLNFKMIKKSIFYYLCEHIYPNQVQSLVLSDDEYSPNQIKLFMSLMPLIQFINLQEFNIDHICDINLLCLMLSHLENNAAIQSLTINTHYVEISKKNSRYMTEILASLLNLKQLIFENSSTLTTLKQPLLQLTHLTIRSSKLVDLKIILDHVPNLLYLNVFVKYDQDLFVIDSLPPKLRSLIFKSARWTLFDDIERLFTLTTSLKRFILEITGELALLNAKRWEMLIQTKLPLLKDFSLSISLDENTLTGPDVLQPFQSTFWVHEKHWYMACLLSTSMNSCGKLFSIPYFSDDNMWYPLSEGFAYYSIAPFSCYDNCTELRVHNVRVPTIITSALKNTRTLSLECDIDHIEQLTKILDLTSVYHLKMSCVSKNHQLQSILQAAPDLYQLTLHCKTLLELMNLLQDDSEIYTQIKQLCIESTVLNDDLNKICAKFPKLEHINLYVKDLKDGFEIFDHLHDLTSATIHQAPPFRKTLTSITIKTLLEDNNVCTDGAYYFHRYDLSVWVD